MRCPRCATNGVEHELRAGELDGFDECARCGGVAIAARTLFIACPSVAGLDRRALEIQLLGKQGQGVQSCAECGKRPFEFPILGVPIDWCAGCGSVWIDGDERAALSVKDRDDRKPQAGAAAYRIDARAASTRVSRCAACNDILASGASFMTSQGLVCKFCQSKIDLGKHERFIEEDRAQEKTWQGQLFAWLRAALAPPRSRTDDPFSL